MFILTLFPSERMNLFCCVRLCHFDFLAYIQILSFLEFRSRRNHSTLIAKSNVQTQYRNI